jgi:hypothetical protein
MAFPFRYYESISYKFVQTSNIRADLSDSYILFPFVKKAWILDPIL